MTAADAGAVGAARASGPAGAPPVLEVRDLSVRFRPRGRDLVRAVSGLSYTVPAGRTVAIIGESGSGKTASSRAIMGLLPRSAQVSGSVLLSGTELIGLSPRSLRRHRGRDVAMIFQDPARSLNPTMKVGPQVAEAVRAHRKVSRAEARERVIELFKLVRLSAPEQRYNEYPHQFSGGMRQRVMIAMALSCSPKLLIADEATTALDVTTQAQIMRLLAELQEQLGMAILMISHDLGLAASYADEVVVMYAGRTVERAPVRELFGSVRMPYTARCSARCPGSTGPRTPRCPWSRAARRTCRRRCPAARSRRAARGPGTKCAERRPAFAEHKPGHWYACWYPLPDAGQPVTGRSATARLADTGLANDRAGRRRRAAMTRPARRGGELGPRTRSVSWWRYP